MFSTLNRIVRKYSPNDMRNIRRNGFCSPDQLILRKLKDNNIFCYRGCRGGTKFRAYCLDRYHRLPTSSGSSSPPSARILNQDAPYAKGAVLNCQSARAKTAVIQDLIMSNKLIFAGLTETWHHELGDIIVRSLTPPGYKFLDKPGGHLRVSGNGGGICFIYQEKLNAKQINIPQTLTSFEYLPVFVRNGSDSFIVTTIYRTGAIAEVFYNEMVSLLESLSQYSCPIYIIGDINFHLELPSNPDSRNLLDILDSFGLVQHVVDPTHTAGHTLDCVISRKDLPAPTISVGLPKEYSDHALITFTVPTKTSPAREEFREYTARDWRKFDVDKFKCDLRSSPVGQDNLSDFSNMSSPTELYDIFNNTVVSLIDRQIPQSVRRKRCLHLNSPWFDADCRRIKRQCRHLERIYRRLKTHNNLNTNEACKLWIAKCRDKQSFFNRKRHSYWLRKSQECRGDSRKMWRTVNSILCKDSHPLNSNEGQPSASVLHQAFEDKLDGIRRATAHAPPPTFCPQNDHIFDAFELISTTDIVQLILNMNCKYSPVDRFPTWLFKSCAYDLAPFITLLFNNSLQLGTFPEQFKYASLTPILKKASLDPCEPSSYRPISNLPVLSKILERAVLTQLLKYLHNNNLLHDFQSAYRQHHSTESAVTKVLSDIYKAADDGLCTVLCMLDLSAAFDSVDHDLLLCKLSANLGIRDNVLKWFKSYLADRYQRVTFQGEESVFVKMSSGVPQGSVLGPILFLLYSGEVLDLILSHGLFVHAYADDLQIYGHADRKSIADLKSMISSCVSSVHDWMCSNRLKLNPSKTEVILLGSKLKYSDFYSGSIEICGSVINFSNTVRSLGVILDNDLSLTAHVNSIVRSSYATLRQLWHIRPSITFDVARNLACSFIHSRLDYCNSVLAGLKTMQVTKLNGVLKATARFVFACPKFASVTNRMINELHWLPFPQRISYKLNIMAFKSVNNAAPAYLDSLFTPSTSLSYRSRLRSAASFQVVTPKIKTNWFGARGFYYSGPSHWNTLPPEFRLPGLTLFSFSKKLKTFLFSQISAHV